VQGFSTLIRLLPLAATCSKAMKKEVRIEFKPSLVVTTHPVLFPWRFSGVGHYNYTIFNSSHIPITANDMDYRFTYFKIADFAHINSYVSWRETDSMDFSKHHHGGGEDGRGGHPSHFSLMLRVGQYLQGFADEAVCKASGWIGTSGFSKPTKRINHAC
jgi:hypothetical protein